MCKISRVQQQNNDSVVFLPTIFFFTNFVNYFIATFKPIPIQKIKVHKKKIYNVIDSRRDKIKARKRV